MEIIEKYHKIIFFTLYWLLAIVPMTILKASVVKQSVFYFILLIMAFFLFGFATDSKKHVFGKTFLMFILFSGVYALCIYAIFPFFTDFSFHDNIGVKFSSDKIVDMKNLDIYVDKNNKKVYEFYSNGHFGDPVIKEKYDLIEKKNSELSLKYGKFYNYSDNVKFAFPSNMTILDTNYLFQVNLNGKEYEFTSIVPLKNTQELLSKAGFKKIVNINNVNHGTKTVLLNQTSKEAALLYDNRTVVQPYVDVPYSKTDEFVYRYKAFNEKIKTPTVADNNQDLTITMIKTFSDVSKDVKRVTFYTEGISNSPYYTFIELIFDNHAIVFKTPYFDPNNIGNVKRLD